jgi:hypothetical protein
MYDVTWPETTNKTLSEPFCLDQTKEFLYRQCSKGNWHDEPACYKVQPKRMPQCPQDFKETDSLCYTITQKSVFPPQCPFKNLQPYNSYSNIISSQNVGPFWLPVRRNTSGFFQWTEASPLYKTAFIGHYYSTRGLKNKDCLLFYNTSYTVAVSCDEEHSGLCAYEKLGRTSQLYPEGSCLESDFDHNLKSFCFANSSEKQSDPLAEFLQRYQNNILGGVPNEGCTFGLEKSPNGTYIWSNTRQEIGYTYWSRDVVFDSDRIYGAVTPNGWILTEKPLSCLLVAKEVPNLTPSLQLTLDDRNGRFLLQISDPRGLKWIDNNILIYCFTDAHPSQIVYRYPTLSTMPSSNNTVSFQFEPLKFGPGSYWCESFKYSDLELVQSGTVFFRPKGFSEFVGILRFKKKSVVLSQEFIDTLQKILLRVEHVTNYYTPRIMKILNLDEENNQVLVNVHFTAKYGNITEEKRYDLLRTAIIDFSNNSEVQMEMLDFFSSDFCPSKTDKLTWPTTSLGREATSVEFCFCSNGSRVLRYCGGNFIDGARWLPIGVECQVVNSSSISSELVALDTSGWEKMVQISEIFKNYHNLTSLDVHLIAHIYSRFPPSQLRTCMSEFFETVNNLLDVEKDVLRESQLKMSATDNLLIFLNKVMNEQCGSVEIVKKNFVFVSTISKNLSGVIVQRNDSAVNVIKLQGDYTIDNILGVKNLESAIWLSPELRSQLNEDDQVSFVVFFNDGFFGEIVSKNVSRVFGVNLPTRGTALGGPVRVLNRLEIAEASCAYWDFEYSRGSWKREDEVEDFSPFQLCDFWRVANLALMVTPKSNLADDLVDVLNSNCTVPETMQKLLTISNRYDEFVPSDVSLVAKILEKVSGDENIDLRVFAEVISNLLGIERSVLSESQVETSATDKILQYVDVIAQGSKSWSGVQIITDNFLLLAVNAKESNFSGLALLEWNQTVEMLILKGEVNTSDLVENSKINSAVVLSSDVKNQIDGDFTMVLTVYLDDKFFKATTFGQVFGVLFGNFSGPVSLFRKISGTPARHECVHWSYDPSASVSGTWQQDSYAEEMSSLIRCEFNHANHFTILKSDDIYQYSAWQIIIIINNINAILSGVGFCGIFLTALLFKKWRQNTGNQILLNFVCSKILELVVFYCSAFFTAGITNNFICIFAGVLLHYSILSEFCWMFAVAILQFQRFVVVLGTTRRHVLLKTCLIGWGLPLVPIISIFVFLPDPYLSYKGGLCFLSSEASVVGLWVPVATIITTNVVIFIYILYSVFHKKTDSSDGGTDGLKHQWRLVIMLFFMLGITWAFGLFSQLQLGIVFDYSFAITSSLQGFVMFVYFIVFNKKTRNLYLHMFHKCCSKEY